MLNSRAIKELVRRYKLGIWPRRMGQNFLVDPRVLARMVGVIGPAPSDRVLEIGGGLGALTEGLIASGAAVTTVEKDTGFLQVLTDRFSGVENLQMVRSDVLELDLASYAAGAPKSLLVVGNIPFSLTSLILEYLLRQRQWVKRAVLTVQKEVALRIVARPGTKVYSSISVLVQVAFTPSIAFTIPPHAFYPQPKVTAAVLRLDPLPNPAVPLEEEEGLLRRARALFTHRRKTLVNSLLASGESRPKEELLKRLHHAGIDPVRRPETFGIQELLVLNRALR